MHHFNYSTKFRWYFPENSSKVLRYIACVFSIYSGTTRSILEPTATIIASTSPNILALWDYSIMFLIKHSILFCTCITTSFFLILNLKRINFIHPCHCILYYVEATYRTHRPVKRTTTRRTTWRTTTSRMLNITTGATTYLPNLSSIPTSPFHIVLPTSPASSIKTSTGIISSKLIILLLCK